jgi:hypothetical protein
MKSCACTKPERHYGSKPCRVTDENLPLGPEGYCWGCWTASHDKPLAKKEARS